MKVLSRTVKKGTALVLSLVLSVGQFQILPNRMLDAQAQEKLDNKLSVTAFATKDELMNTFDANGTNNITGKITYGKDGKHNLVEWYVLGKDSGIEGENIAIFAATPIATDIMLEVHDTENKEYVSSFGEYELNPSEVYPNQYGSSDLRNLLKTISSSLSNFTSAEMSFMQATTVTTKDTLNDKLYTTTDVLYALAGEENGMVIRAGSNDEKILPMKDYWESGKYLWLRSPHNTNASLGLVAEPNVSVHESNVYNNGDVRPATNLDVASVMFASAATVATTITPVKGEIAEGTAMTLRRDGTDVYIGTVTIDSTQGIVLAERIGNGISIVIQGNDGYKDWFYSKLITGKETISFDDIKMELGLGNDVKLSDCKVWLETTIDNVAYAKMAVEEPAKEETTIEEATTKEETTTEEVTTKEETTTEEATTKEETTTEELTIKEEITTTKKESTGNIEGTTEKPVQTEAKLSKVANLRQDANYSTNKITMTWSTVKGADGYAIYRATSKEGSYKYLKTVTKNTATDANVKAGSKYYYKVRAYKTVNGISNYGAFSEEKSMVTKPATPTNVDYSITGPIVELTWTKVAGVSGYEICSSYTSDYNNKTTKNVGAYVTSYCFLSFVEGAGNKAYFKVRAYAKNGAGQKVYSAYSKTVMVEQPKVTGLKQITSYGTSTSKITMSWSKVKGADGYIIYRATSKNGSYKYVKSVAANTATNTGLKAGDKYYYKVCAYKKVSGKTIYGMYSDVKSMVTKPATPINVDYTIEGPAVELTWTKVAGASGYEICSSYTSDYKNKITTNVGADKTSRVFLSYKSYMEGNKKVYFKVRAYAKNGAGQKVYSGYSKTVTAEAVSGVKYIQQADYYGTRTIALEWGMVNGAEGYELYRATSKNGSYKLIKITDTNKLLDEGLKAGRKYYYKVRAFKGTKNRILYGGFSDVKCMITNPEAPTISSVALGAGGGMIEVKWKKVSGANGYEIYISDKADYGYKNITNAGGDAVRAACRREGVEGTGKHYLKIRAYTKNAAGKKFYSEYSEIKTVILK